MFIHIECRENENAVIAWRRAFQQARAEKAEGVFFLAGVYHFYPEGTSEKYCFFSNNDSGIKKIVFLLEDLTDFSLTGDWAEFIFHGRLSPLAAYRCRNLSLRGFSIDFADSFVSDAEITAVGEETTDLLIRDPRRVENGRLRFFDDVYDTVPEALRLLRFDPVRREPAADAVDQICPQQGIIELDKDRVRIPVRAGKPGDILAVKHQLRYNPAMVFDSSEQIGIQDVGVHHSGGMACLLQSCTNIRLDGFRVTPSPRYKRLVSASDDAIHMVECRSSITIENCLLENQWDDAVNVHGVYRLYRRRNAGSEPFEFLETRHYQQMGIEPLRPGDVLEFIKTDTLKAFHTAEVRTVRRLNQQMSRIEFAEPLSLSVTDGDAVRNLTTAQSTLLIRNSIFRRNKPRGILVSGIEKAVIEKNYFHTAGAAVYISGDANFWFEAGPVGEVEINGNTFEYCNFMATATGNTTIAIVPEIPKLEPGFHYHGSVYIHHNRFITVNPNIVHAVSTKYLDFQNNEIIIGTEQKTNNHAVTEVNCGEIIIK
jgi:hypothetical protein